ncbi:MAG TPA: TIM-barrel domain-containing protein [Ktedonobacterales bacterium]|nr:TIM-barrel domain-containing protein [Ktedonobacterales bacterium]
MTEPSPTVSTPHSRGWQRTTASAHFTAGATTNDILRIAFASVGAPPHRTWSLAPSSAGLHADSFEIDDQGDTVSLRTSALQASLHLSDDGRSLHLRIARPDGSVLMESATIGMSGAGQPNWTSTLAHGECIYGGGERTGRLNKRGRSMTFWTTDPLPNHGDSTDAMYQSVPFLIGLVGGKAHGIYFDVNERAVADIGKTQPDTLTYMPLSADLVAYVFAGPTLGDVLRQYTALTGRVPALPRWVFGNQQSRWGYMSADEVLEIANQFRTRAIPCDAIYLDIDYMDGYRVFTWNTERFPDPAGMIQKLGEQHMRLVTIIDPGVKVDRAYRVYQEGTAKGYFARTADGTPFEGWVWPGLSCWADFSREDVRAWWGDQHRILIEAGVAGIWNDMNEPAQAGISAPADVSIPHGGSLPDDVLHGTSGDTITHAQFHNAYGLEMGQATYEGLRRLRPDERPFVLTRAATAGSQRYAIVWNGDSASSWDNLRLAIPLNLGSGLSGFPVTGGDVGGFWQDTTAELLVRWTQLGALMPFCRNHSATGTRPQEPWAFGDPYTGVCRAALERRYQLLPYMLTLAHEATITGAPMIRPLAWIAPTHADCIVCDDEFLLGNAVLAAPVMHEGATSREVLLPPGEWFVWDSSELFAGDQRLTIPVTLDTIPLYVRAGTILPLAAVAQSTAGMTEQPLTLHVYLTPGSPSARTDIWLDDDHPQAEQRGSFAQWQAVATWQEDAVTVAMRRTDGQLPWPYPGCSITLHLPDGWHVEPLSEANMLQGDEFTIRYRVSQG